MDELSLRLRKESLEVLEDEPELGTLLHQTVLADDVISFDDAVASTVSYRLLLGTCNSSSSSDRSNNTNSTTNNNNGNKKGFGNHALFCPTSLRCMLNKAMKSTELECGHTMSEAIRRDALSIIEKDPATETLLEVVLFYKGYAALVVHRAAHREWKEKKNKMGRRSHVALFLQSQASAVFGVDIHPAAEIGFKILLDHGTGIVIGETARVGDGTTILHGVTLGGTGKITGDRHPKVGKNTLIGAMTSILGNITIGDGAKIGAGSVVLRSIPAGATAVGSPAKIIGRSKEANPGSTMDNSLRNLNPMVNTQKKKQHSTIATVASVSSTLSSSVESSQSDNYLDGRFVTFPLNQTETLDDDHNGSHFLCPYRDYVKIAETTAPENSVTFVTLQKSLSPLGLSTCQIGSIFLALDINHKGYLPLRQFLMMYRNIFDLYAPSFCNSHNVGKLITKNCTVQLLTLEDNLEKYAVDTT